MQTNEPRESQDIPKTALDWLERQVMETIQVCGKVARCECPCHYDTTAVQHGDRSGCCPMPYAQTREVAERG